MSQFTGKVALITGGNAGIGRAAAIEFAKQGAKVVVSGRREKEGHEVVAEIKALGGEAIFVKTDVSKASDVKAMIEQTLATFGRLDFAFNNAGVEQLLTPLPDQSEETYDQIMDINVKGVWLCAKVRDSGDAQDRWRRHRQQLFRCGTDRLRRGSGLRCQQARRQRADQIGRRWNTPKQNVRVNAVAPGAIETRMYHDFVARAPEAKQMLESGNPMGRVGQPEEIASIVIWLCSAGRIVHYRTDFRGRWRLHGPVAQTTGQN